MGILDDYKAQLEEDRKNENNDFPEDCKLNESQREEYEKRLQELINDANDIENVYERRIKEMRHLTEKEMDNANLTKVEEIDKILVKHVFCEECGEELISKTPQLFNPYTLESICKHTCSKCGKVYNLQHAYPRIIFLNNNGEEIPAFTR